jgi:hypothetical protein
LKREKEGAGKRYYGLRERSRKCKGLRFKEVRERVGKSWG